MPATSSLQAALSKVRQHGLKYSAVSIINVAVGQALLVLFAALLHNAWVANILAVCLSAIPAYYLTRAWVWGKKGKSHLTKEVLPFWGFAFAGLIMSTVFYASLYFSFVDCFMFGAPADVLSEPRDVGNADNGGDGGDGA